MRKHKRRHLMLLLVFMGLVCRPVWSRSTKSIIAERDAGTPKVICDVAAAGLFDPTNKEYAIEEGVVTVDTAMESAKCPTGLGHLASGRPSVKEIRLVLRNRQSGDCWLHISWNPGGSGQEQFEVLCNGNYLGKGELRDGSKHPYQTIHEQFEASLTGGENVLVLRHLSGDGLRFERITLAETTIVPAMINPRLKFPTLASYEEEIKEPAVLINGRHIRMYAPKRRAKEARIIFSCLTEAYEELYSIVGFHTKYKIAVCHFPPGNPNASGSTSNCTVWYSNENLELESDEEWKQHGVPHVSGYIEEMAHNFVSASHAQFGWEMIGWSIAAKVCRKVAANPIYARHLKLTRQGQAETFRRYRSLGNTFPKDIPANQCDRIHAHILWMCEQRYGPEFWVDFFKEIATRGDQFTAADRTEFGDERRNRRYQITVDCLDRVLSRKGIDFKKDLKTYGVSLSVDVKSLNPSTSGWNRKLH